MKLYWKNIRVVVALFGLTASAAEANAQSVLATRGLGYLTQPQGARTLGLGGVGLGLPGTEISWANPAAGVGLPAPGFLLVYQYDNFSAEGAGNDFDGKTARFPLILAAIPAGERFTVQAGFGSFLEQNWRILEADTLFLGADTVPVIDWSQSNGGVSRLRVGGGAAVVTDLSVGLGLDVYIGSVERLVGRSFPFEPRPACCRATWNYSGIGVTGSLQWSPTADSGIGASVTYGGTLKASPQDSIGLEAKYDLPISFQAGASGRVGPNTLVILGGSWSGWSDLQEPLAADGGANNSWSANAGVEWDGLSIADSVVPLRLGARTSTLPFRWDEAGGEHSISERAVSLGVGAVFADGGVRPDAFLEFGNRGGDDAGIDESFWRVGFSVSVLGR
jgi:hypothetical protein